MRTAGGERSPSSGTKQNHSLRTVELDAELLPTVDSC